MDLIRYSVLISLSVNEKFYSAKIERKETWAAYKIPRQVNFVANI